MILTAPAPPRLIPGGRYSVGFAAEVAVAKHLDHMPLTRQVRQMKRQGLEVTSQTLWDQLLALSKHLAPTYQALQEYVLASPVIGADETTWRLMDERGSKTHWAWSITREDAVYYRIDASRSAEAASKILGAYAGTIVCDGYSAYSALRKQRQRDRDGPPAFDPAHCWAHVRRKFVEAEPHYPEVGQVLELIGELYAIEAEAKATVTADVDLHARRSALRHERSREVVAKIRGWMLAQRALPKSAIGRAIAYADGVWPGLTRFVEDARVPLDNNQTERTMRGVAVGRKNHYGSRSLRGTEVAAVFYSLIETAKLAGLEPAAYLREAARRAIITPGTVTLPRDLVTG
jgi:transposase